MHATQLCQGSRIASMQMLFLEEDYLAVGSPHLECKYDASAIAGRGASLLVSLKGSGLQL